MRKGVPIGFFLTTGKRTITRNGLKPIKRISEMNRPKGVKPKRWQRSLEIAEMNRRIIKNKMKSSMYVSDWLDEALMDAGEYKANKKKKK